MGLKLVMNTIYKGEYSLEDIAASFQWTVASTLSDKTFQAAAQFNRNKIVVGGGVAANQEIRRVFTERAENTNNIKVFFPDIARCTDNGEMIAYAAYRFYKFRNFLNYKGSAYDTKHSIGLI